MTFDQLNDYERRIAERSMELLNHLTAQATLEVDHNSVDRAALIVALRLLLERIPMRAVVDERAIARVQPMVEQYLSGRVG